MGGIAVPTLIRNTANDLDCARWGWPPRNEAGKGVTLCYTDNGGHVGFVTTRQNDMKHFAWMPDRCSAILRRMLDTIHG